MGRENFPESRFSIRLVTYVAAFYMPVLKLAQSV